MKNKDAIKFDPKGGGADFIMHKSAQSVWITVGGLSINIQKIVSRKMSHPGVSVEIFALHHEACCEALDACAASQVEKEKADRDHQV